ncbi:MAG: hypothetical protein JSS07_00230 [Proteobacteria bacterium]|nr:hypothetical protein [Pseudomonadota bacterium]
MTPEQRFPWWFVWIKWLLPITLGFLASMWIGLTMTAVIPTFHFLQWLPGSFAALEVFPAISVLTLTMGAMASTVSMACTILVRAALFNTAEKIANENSQRLQELAQTHQKLNVNFEEKCKSTEATIKNLVAENKDLSQRYYLLQGSRLGSDYKDFPINLPQNTSTQTPKVVALPTPIVTDSASGIELPLRRRYRQN